MTVLRAALEEMRVQFRQTCAVPYSLSHYEDDHEAAVSPVQSAWRSRPLSPDAFPTPPAPQEGARDPTQGAGCGHPQEQAPSHQNFRGNETALCRARLVEEPGES